MTMQDIKQMKTVELQTRVEELRAELFALKFQSATGQLATPHRIKEIKKEIARILTDLNQRKANGEDIKPLDSNKLILPESMKEDSDKEGDK